MNWVNIICFTLLCGGLFSIFEVRLDDIMTVFYSQRNITLNDELSVLLGSSVKWFFNRDYEIGQILKDTGRKEQFEFVKRLSLILFAVGAVLALMIDNVYMAPILGGGFSLAPVWYLRSTKAKMLGAYRISDYTPEYRETSGVG